MKRVVAAVIEKDGKLLVCQRTRHQTMPLKWEFPGGKIEEGEQPRDALRRELEEELGIQRQNRRRDCAYCSILPERSHGGVAILCRARIRGEIENRIFRDLQWSAPEDLGSMIFLKRMLPW